ncbi:hypothetical protein Q3G72_021590 [Acer saccharum]|nr:hypothetical protein Q3G72_021590 [Acer saccharum]
MEAITGRIVGTYGYAPPEYVKKGIYSTKSDVYSFGVLVLQIISGKRVSIFYGENNHLSLLEYAYELWKDGKGMEFMNPSLDDTYSPCKRTIHFNVHYDQIQYMENERVASSTDRKEKGSVAHVAEKRWFGSDSWRRGGLNLGSSLQLAKIDSKSGSAEVQAIHKACNLISSNPLLNDRSITIVSDSRSAVSWINSDNFGNLNLVNFVYDIRNCIQSRVGISIIPTNREVNSLSDSLAKALPLPPLSLPLDEDDADADADEDGNDEPNKDEDEDDEDEE